MISNNQQLSSSEPCGRIEAPTRARAGVFAKTFGCAMNEYDTEKVLQLISDTHVQVHSVEEAEMVFINTCAIREKSEHKLFSLLGSMRELKLERPNLVIGVAGCVAQQEGQKILKRNPAVDFVVGTHNLSLVPALMRSVRDGRGPQVAVDYREDWEQLPEFGIAEEPESPAFGKVRALIAIQRGCNKRCAFCVVPTTRGPEVSRSPQEILREIKLKARLGSKEVLLLGQTVNSYGRDLSPRYSFERLIQEIADVEGVERIRFISPHPADVRESFLDLYSKVPQLCRHIHLPLQSGSDRILKLMNRNYRRERYLEIVDSLRQRCPDIALTTDIIVGFPTETQEDFEQSVEMLQRVKYHLAFSFSYSRRPNTLAMTKFGPEDEVPLETAKRRLADLQQIQEDIGFEIHSRLIGSEVDVLVEDNPPNGAPRCCGRIVQNTPIELMAAGEEPGSLIPASIKPGMFIRARVEHCTPYGLRGRILEESARPIVVVG